jgi:hypothetical protein
VTENEILNHARAEKNRYGWIRRSVVVVVVDMGGGIGVIVRSVVVVVCVTGGDPPHATNNVVARINADPTARRSLGTS